MDSNIKVAVEKVVNKHVQKRGQIAASELVKIARPEKSIIHAAFEWDDAKAGELFRLEEARRWIRVVRVTIDKKEDRLVHVPSVEGPRTEGAYKPMSVLVENVDEWERALEEATKRFYSAKVAMDALVDLARASDDQTKAAVVAQIARGLDLLQEAINQVRH